MPPCFKQPVYSGSFMEHYCPMGNYFLIRTTAWGDVRIHELPFHDPQYVAQAVLPSLDIFKSIPSVDHILLEYSYSYSAKMLNIGDGQPAVAKQIRDDHYIVNYSEKINLLDGKGSPPGVEEGEGIHTMFHHFIKFFSSTKLFHSYVTPFNLKNA